MHTKHFFLRFSILPSSFCIRQLRAHPSCSAAAQPYAFRGQTFLCGHFFLNFYFSLVSVRKERSTVPIHTTYVESRHDRANTLTLFYIFFFSNSLCCQCAFGRVSRNSSLFLPENPYDWQRAVQIVWRWVRWTRCVCVCVLNVLEFVQQIVNAMNVCRMIFIFF